MDREQTFTAVLCREGMWYVAHCPEIGTVSQGESIEEAVENLKEATELYLEELASPQEFTAEPAILTTFRAVLHA
jgi:predicted RNase H-like HicB family nuclease